ncbi:hypothetical protein FA15DRAFT_674792 [Coprinopsis marcescibilis]|uniref:Uncharacterized protein n=1 Tax=Coprinopsis marcescibilis TaxID=230819 RepID=A0A5C3KFW9_COPMA|nr:hypothetical protein FA15DRAFT_674792 [Coprinopsis marcescibilis]
MNLSITVFTLSISICWPKKIEKIAKIDIHHLLPMKLQALKLSYTPDDWQAHAIQRVLQGYDIIICAGTGFSSRVLLCCVEHSSRLDEYVKEFCVGEGGNGHSASPWEYYYGASFRLHWCHQRSHSDHDNRLPLSSHRPLALRGAAPPSPTSYGQPQ